MIFVSVTFEVIVFECILLLGAKSVSSLKMTCYFSMIFLNVYIFWLTAKAFIDYGLTDRYPPIDLVAEWCGLDYGGLFITSADSDASSNLY